MKKSTIVWLIVAASLILVGAIIFGGLIMALNFDFKKLNTNKFETNTHMVSEPFDSIVIDTDTADITFLPSEDESCKVVCNELENINHSVEVVDGKLTIKCEDTRKWYEYIGINFGKTTVTVYLPQSEYKSISIDESTGDVYIPSNFKFERIDVTVSTGDIACYSSTSGKIKLKASTGDIKLENLSAGSLDISVSTGRVTALSVVCEGDINLKASTGDATLTNITCKNLSSKASTGKLIMNNVVASGNFSIERDTGDVRFERCDASEITIVTDTGDVKGTLLSDKIFIANTDTGRKQIPETTTGGKCKITTDTGNIIIEIVSD